MRIAINGMGRIGRLLFRRLINDSSVEIVAVNDIMKFENLAYLLKYDSVYGPLETKFAITNNQLIINKKPIEVFSMADPEQLPWDKLNVDVVLECSGMFTNRAGILKHIHAGAEKVLLSTTGAEEVPLGIFGHNQHSKQDYENILSVGGCMTNCSVHVLNILLPFGIESAHINILHSYTSRQELVDKPHPQFRRGRAAAESIIPVDIDLYKSLNRLFPDLKEKIHTASTRIPVANGAMASFFIQLQNNLSVIEINNLFKKSAQEKYHGIIEYTEDPIVSLDIKGNVHSCIIDGTQTAIVCKHIKVVAWFDNEFGFTSRLIDWLHFFEKQ